jgi:hypothetical protein
MRILQIQTLESKKEQKFVEYDDLLKHAMFQIFCDFIDDNGFQPNDLSDTEGLSQSMIDSMIIYNERCEKAQRIYNHWKQRDEEWDIINSEKNSNKYHILRDEFKAKELQMMRDIVELSPGMWT